MIPNPILADPQPEAVKTRNEIILAVLLTLQRRAANVEYSVTAFIFDDILKKQHAMVGLVVGIAGVA
jgi:hypothetical protein